MMAARQELTFLSPWLNAPGFCGFTPGAGWPLDEPQGMFFTNPVTLKARPLIPAGRIIETPGGFLWIHSLPNPGLAKVLKMYAEIWRCSKTPLCVHICPEDATQAGEMARRIEEEDCVQALEVECPPDCPPEAMPPFWQAAAGELPLIVRLPPGLFSPGLAVRMAAAGVEGVSLGALAGMARDETGRLVGGMLYGPAALPQMLGELFRWRKSGLAVIAGGGLFRKADAEAALAAGAAAVQLDAVLWRPGGWNS